MFSLGTIEWCDGDVFEPWDCEMRMMAKMGNRKWPDQAKVAVPRTEKNIRAHSAEQNAALGYWQIAPVIKCSRTRGDAPSRIK